MSISMSNCLLYSTVLYSSLSESVYFPSLSLSLSLSDDTHNHDHNQSQSISTKQSSHNLIISSILLTLSTLHISLTYLTQHSHSHSLNSTHLTHLTSTQLLFFSFFFPFSKHYYITSSNLFIFFKKKFQVNLNIVDVKSIYVYYIINIILLIINSWH